MPVFISAPFSANVAAHTLSLQVPPAGNHNEAMFLFFSAPCATIRIIFLLLMTASRERDGRRILRYSFSPLSHLQMAIKYIYIYGSS